MSDETTPPPEPRWGDPIGSILAERREQLTKLAEEQRAWVDATGADRDPKQSPLATKAMTILTGAEVFFLAVEAYATAQRILAATDYLFARRISPDEAERLVRGTRALRHNTLHLEGANLEAAHLEDANLFQAHLERAGLSEAHLERAEFGKAHLEGASLSEAHLEGADLRGAFFSTETILPEATITDTHHGAAQVADVRWQDVNLAVITQWGEVEMLGDEQEARELAKKPLPNPQKLSYEPLPKGASRADRKEARKQRGDALLVEWRRATRANRQLATVMRDQGMNDEADRFAYRGQLCQRELYQVEGRPFRSAFSRFLDFIAGYGYKPERSLVAYVLIILGFALAYFFIGQTAGPPLSPFGAFVFSMTSFHGRGFFPGGISIDDPLTGTAAFEALAGLIIEISFIATFTQRFFGR